MDPEKAELNTVLASAPGTVTVNDRTFLCEKFTTAQVFSLYEWATETARKAYNPFKEVMDALVGLPVSESQKSELLMQAHRVKTVGEVPTEEVSRALRSNEGVAFQLFLLTRKHHANETYESLKAMVNDENRLDIYVQMDVASGANIVNKAMVNAGFFPPAQAGNTGS